MAAPGAPPAANTCSGLFGNGLVTDACGTPLGPGGAEVTEDLLNRAGFRAGEHVIDIGCGQGRAIGHMLSRGLRVTGIDTDPEALLAAQGRVSGASFLNTGGDDLPFADGAVDGIISECVLSVMPDKTKTLAEWHRVLREGGRVAISDVYARHPVPAPEARIGTNGILSAARLREIMAAAGFLVTSFFDRSDLLRTWVGRFIFQYGSLDALWGDAATGEAMRRIAPGYCVIVAAKQRHGEPEDV